MISEKINNTRINRKVFQTTNDLELIVISRKSAVIFEIDNYQEENQHCFQLEFSPEMFKELLEHIEGVSNKSWINIDPKEANSCGSDYNEYYDRKFDNNGYMKIKKCILFTERPSLESNKLYQFNKRKIESFIYDFRKIIAS